MSFLDILTQFKWKVTDMGVNVPLPEETSEKLLPRKDEGFLGVT